MIIKTKDKIVQRVLAKMDQRSLVGQALQDIIVYDLTIDEVMKGKK